MSRIFQYNVLETSTRDWRPSSSSTNKLQSSSKSRSSSFIAGSVAQDLEKPKTAWLSFEFFFYYSVLGSIIILACFRLFGVSNAKHPNFINLEKHLKPGWMFGRKVDVSDHQYASFRENMPILLGVIAGYFLLWNAIRLIFSHKVQDKLALKNMYRFWFSMVFSLIVYGSGMIYVFSIVFIYYLISKVFRDHILNPLLSWGFSIFLLLYKEHFGLYKFANLHPFLSFLDDHTGILERWYVLFNISILRLISYNLDYYWSIKYPSQNLSAVLVEKERNPNDLSYSDRIRLNCNPEDYNIKNFLGYVFYAPLYLAGPIITYNNFVSQTKYQIESPLKYRNFYYGLRFLVCVMLMEFLLHFCYVTAITKEKSLHAYTTLESSMASFVVLFLTWLKLLIPWRLFRWWSLMDDIEPPENIIRCMCNNYSAIGFWRAWHRSYNRWLIRYLYIPIGGKKYPILNSFLIFTFVALWHDVSWELFFWGWLIVLFILPERLCSYASFKFGWTRHPQYRLLAGIGGALNLYFMVICNLIGFVMDIHGIKDMLFRLFGTFQGIYFSIVAILMFFSASQMMIEIRKNEEENGLDLPC
ncbi:membrane bound O-acyltransferase [Schizosaccharomyces cryophilus OY26]|uniref:Membrane bound O-acyltransferase n=1 Tax=Schizosaccharomyces cryophilus (strain OY26 / ATCC MYA-4695 / CBS 11777 / NBRC 106824 / NRRL Y48691) TaxID=653667 RepID=S9VTZ8_SCHCR|nr:membrane bound O-acyltransferase [Schizosaccharomyces cryophilus OY26]EPY49659.1 membrane bound O-acyltransferase [Schizosaccharomyces cryophilus OY26]